VLIVGKQGPRAQIDRVLYKRHMQDIMFNYTNLDVKAGSVHDLVLQNAEGSAASKPDTWAKVGGVRLGQ
jgi:tRNA uridine 5-carboxymethylaminomethyl modification enzyme